MMQLMLFFTLKVRRKVEVTQNKNKNYNSDSYKNLCRGRAGCIERCMSGSGGGYCFPGFKDL